MQPELKQSKPRGIMQTALLVLLILSACGEAPQTRQMPPPNVIVETIGATTVPNLIELPGRIEAVRSAEVRARVDGIVERQLFTDGTDVAVGTPLFAIDPRDLTAQRQQAQARLETAQAASNHAASVAARFAPLIARRAISAQEYEAALNAQRQANASVREAKAALDRAQLQFGYSTVRSPIAGRIGRAQVSEGALVSAAQGTLMAQVDQLSPLFATFSQSSIEILDLQLAVREGRIKLPDIRKIEVRLLKENGEDYGIVGFLDFAEQAVDPTSGGQMVRARFANPQRLLLPGQFVRGIISAGTVQNGVAIPQRAVQISGDEASVFTVGPDNNVVRRIIMLAGQSGDRWIVRSGLTPGEKLIVDGWQKVQPGQKVAISAAPGTKPAKPAA